MPPLPPMSSEEVQNSRVPSLHGHYPASSLLRTRPPPSRRRTISRDPRLYARPASADFAAGRGGLLQLLDAAASPCCRSKPRRSAPPRQPERPRGLEVDDQLELRRLLDGKVSGLGAFQDLVHISSGTPIHIDAVRPIRYETPVVRPVPCSIDRR